MESHSDSLAICSKFLSQLLETYGKDEKKSKILFPRVNAQLKPRKKSIVSKAKFEELETACYLMFSQQRSNGAPVSGPLLKEKAIQLFHSIYPESTNVSFVASSGWLCKFIARHGIRGISLQGEVLSADTSPFKSELLNKIELEGYSLDQVFNADETGLWWKLMPSKSLVLHGEKQAKKFKRA